MNELLWRNTFSKSCAFKHFANQYFNPYIPSPGRDGSGVLRSVDEILRTDHHNMPANLSGGVRGMAGARAGLSRYMDEEVLDRYNAPIFDR